MYKITTRCLYALLLLCFCNACSSTKKTTQKDYNRLNDERSKKAIIVVNDSSVSTVNDINTALKEKYGSYLNVSPDKIENIKLYAFIDKWLNTPYKWGGTDEHGIDCSAFLQRLFQDVYDLKLPRTSIEQLYTKCIEPFRSSRHLSEGDIVFFRTMKNTSVSHVGIYLHNYGFVNSSLTKGVSLGRLNDPYWKKRFVVAGRINVSFAKKFIKKSQ